MTVMLVRHGRSHANTSGLLAGRTEAVSLDERGLEQSVALAGRLRGVPIRTIVCSPLLRCQQTVDPLAQELGLEPVPDTRLIKVDYGEWTGRPLTDLVKEPLWAVVQQHPSAVVFPGGESLAQVQARAVAAVREYDRALAEANGGDALWIACTHGDVIKSIVADALGLHLDGFQRIIVEPASVSVVRYTATRPFLYHLNDSGSDFAHFAPREKPGAANASDAVVGGDVPR